jgi:hypothetical protein
MPHPFRAVPKLLWDIIFTNCHVPLAVVNERFEFEEVNYAFCQLLQRPASHLLGQEFQAVTRSEDIGPDIALADKVRRGDMPGYSLVKAYLAPDWSLVWVQISVQGYFEADRFICFYVVAVPVEAPVVAAAVQPERATGVKSWLSQNWIKLLPYALAVFAASYEIYARYVLQNAESTALKQRVEQLEKRP